MNRLAASLLAVSLAGCATGPAPLDLSGSRVAVPPVPKWGVLRDLLATSRYDDLDAVLEQYRAASLWDLEHGEEPLILAYRAMEFTDHGLRKQLDHWVRERPKSWHARTARAFCRLELAARARGGGWWKDLSSARIAAMTKFHRAASTDARTALALQPRNLAPHFILLGIARHGSIEDFDATTRDALQAFPASYMLRFETARSLQPRWKGGDGNYAPIEAFVKESQQYAPENPRLRRLLAMPYWARGEDLSTSGRYAEAVGLYNAALAIAEETSFLYARARALVADRQYRRAFRDARRLEEITPPTEDAPGLGLMFDIATSARQWIAANLTRGDVAEAIATLDVLLEQRPNDGFLTLVRGVARCRSGMVPAALKDFERARTIDPASAHVERMQAACLASGGKPEDAIAGAQARLLKGYANAVAQNELAGLYSLAGDAMSAVGAYRAACELKLDDACRRFDELRSAVALFPQRSWPAAVHPGWKLHAQEQLQNAAEYEAFIGRLASSKEFVTDGSSVEFVEKPLPPFPAWARRAPKGSVGVVIYFNADGTVAGAKVDTSEPQGYFELAAITAVLRWRIEPRQTGLKARQRIEFRMPPDKPADDAEQDILLALARTLAAPP